MPRRGRPTKEQSKAKAILDEILNLAEGVPKVLEDLMYDGAPTAQIKALEIFVKLLRDYERERRAVKKAAAPPIKSPEERVLELVGLMSKGGFLPKEETEELLTEMRPDTEEDSADEKD